MYLRKMTLLLCIYTLIVSLQAFGCGPLPYQYPRFLSANKKYEAIFHGLNKIVVYTVNEDKCIEYYRVQTGDFYIPSDLYISNCGKVLICGTHYSPSSFDDIALMVYNEGRLKKKYSFRDLFDVGDTISCYPYERKILLSSHHFIQDSTGYSPDYTQFALMTNQGKRYLYDIKKDTLFKVSCFNYVPITLNMTTKIRPPQRVIMEKTFLPRKEIINVKCLKNNNLPIYFRDILALMKDSIEFDPAIIHHEIICHDSILTDYIRISGSIEVYGQRIGINIQSYKNEIEEILGSNMRSYNTIDTLKSDCIDLKKNLLDKLTRECTIEEVSYRIERYPFYYIRLVYERYGFKYRAGFICDRRNYDNFLQDYKGLKNVVHLMRRYNLDRKYFTKNDTVAVEHGYNWSLGNKIIYDPRKSVFLGYIRKELIQEIK